MQVTINVIEKKLLETQDATSFDEIFAAVQKQMMPVWKAKFPKWSEKEILEDARGEVYKILTISGRFNRTPDGLWLLKLD
ncbi:hypothetical protein ACW95P_00405 [Candidatus Mycoplasma pogonae]